MTRTSKILAVLFILAFILRLLATITAYHGDLNNNISWGNLAVERGLPDFYEGENWSYSAPNQPPLSILTFAGTRHIWNLTYKIIWDVNNKIKWFPSSTVWFWEDKGMILLVKLPAILADLGIAWIIYQYFRRKNQKSLGLKLLAVWLFNPLVWYNSAIWGQTDAVVNLLGLGAVILLIRKNLVLSVLLFTLSILFKGSLFAFVPILIFVALKQKHKVAVWFKAVSISIVTVVLSSIWFHPRVDLFAWLFNLYIDRIIPGEIGYLSANAFNLWWLVNPGKVLDSKLFIGIPARMWGIFALTIGFVGIIYWLNKKISEKRIFISLTLLSLITFLFMTRIHERYLYPLFPYATIVIGLFPQILLPYALLSITHLLNLYHLFWEPPIELLEALYNQAFFANILSVINILIFVYLLRLLRRAKI